MAKRACEPSLSRLRAGAYACKDRWQGRLLFRIIEPMRRDPIYTARARELRQNANDAEQRLWSILRAKRLGGFKFRRQHALGQYIADFISLSPRLVTEVHADPPT